MKPFYRNIVTIGIFLTVMLMIAGIASAYEYYPYVYYNVENNHLNDSINAIGGNISDGNISGNSISGGNISDISDICDDNVSDGSGDSDPAQPSDTN